MLNARESRELANQAQAEALIKARARIFEDIENAAREGKTSTYVTDIPPTIAQEF